MLDFLCTVLEFVAVLEFLSLFSGGWPRKHFIVLYFVSTIICSAFFAIFKPQILFLNIFLYLLTACFSLDRNSWKERLLFSCSAVLSTIYLEFTLLVAIPSSYLQTDTGNLIVTLSMVLILAVLLIISKYRKAGSIISELILRHPIIILCLLACAVVLGQAFLLKLSVFWSYLPGMVALLILIIAVIALIVYIESVKSSYRLEASLATKNLEESEVLISSLRTQIHDFQAHLRYLDGVVSSADSIDQIKKEFSSYSQELTNDWKLPRMILAIADPSLRYSLYSCYLSAEKNHIPFNLTISPLIPSFSLSPYQIVRVIDNLFQNAVDYNLTLDPDKRFIRLDLFADEKVNRMLISNPFFDEDITLNDMFSYGKTTKGNGHQGLGLPGIRQLLNENGIEFYGIISHEKESITFVCEQQIQGDHSI